MSGASSYACTGQISWAAFIVNHGSLNALAGKFFEDTMYMEEEKRCAKHCKQSKLCIWPKLCHVYEVTMLFTKGRHMTKGSLVSK